MSIVDIVIVLVAIALIIYGALDLIGGVLVVGAICLIAGLLLLGFRHGGVRL